MAQSAQAMDYEAWKQAAIAKDARSGGELWKQREASGLYDYKVIRRRLDELVEVRASGDTQRLLFYLHEGIHGNMAGMGSPALYSHANFGTKHLITSYVNEMVAALEQLETSEVSWKDKLNFFRRAGDCFGRSALMLSGAGSLGPFHMGVVKALCDQELLPNVISGASAGSIVTALAGTRTQQELSALFTRDEISHVLEATNGTKGSGGMMQRQDLTDLVDALIPDLTFEEAFELTGRYINVSVAPAELHQRSRLLNVVTSPNACIREAVVASCAIPGVFPAVTLAAKTATGERKPYVASRKWIDGSVTDDLPARRLTRLYGVNHFISSQANPVVLWSLRDPDNRSLFNQLASVYQSALRDWSRAIYPFTMDIVRNVYPVNIMTRMWFALLTQEYTADINIMPNFRWVNPTKLLARLSAEETQRLVDTGERAAWPKIEMIRNCTAVSRFNDAALRRLEAKLIA